MDRDKGGSGSPPTDRVVAVVELLAGREMPCTIAEIADGLQLSRSTVGAVLGALDTHGWVQRGPDLRYRLGSRLAGVAEAARAAMGAPPGLDDALTRLAAQVDCGAALGVVSATELTFVAVDAGRGDCRRASPRGRGCRCWHPRARRCSHSRTRLGSGDGWVPSRGRRRPRPRRCSNGFGRRVWVCGHRCCRSGTLDVLADVVELLAADPSQHTLRARVLALLGESVDALTAQGISEVEKLCRSATSSRRCSTPMVARCGNCRSARCVPRSRPRNVHTTSNN